MAMFRLSVFWLSTLCFQLEVRALDRVSEVTLPVCRVLNASVNCLAPCWSNMWEVTLLMTGHNGAKVHPDIKTILSKPDNVTAIGDFQDAPDGNGTLLTYTASCCSQNVTIAAIDEHGNRGPCNFTIRWPSAMVTGQQDKSVRSNSPNTIISLWTTSLLLALAALLL